VEIATASHQWWRADPDPDLLEETVDGIQSLERERRALLATLLGPHWESPDELLGVPATSIAFTGPQLGSLPAEAKWAVCDIEARSREQLRAHTAAQEKDGKPVDPAFTARLRQQTREELAKVLTPEQLEEYLLRYSRNADRLRETVRGFDATAEEFRKLFRATDPLDQQLDTLGASADAATERRRAELQRQRDEAARQALGDKRYEFYRLNQDPVFQDVRETAEQLGADAASVLPLYQIQKEVARERNRILQDASLSPEDQSRELGLVYQHQLDSVRKLMGEEAFKKYQALSGR
jgi:hypothetical protein